MGESIRSFEELDVFKMAWAGATEIFGLTKAFPKEETYSLVDQIRRSSRSVCANIGEAWRKRRYRAAFVAKLTDAECEASETLVWIRFAHECGYVDGPRAARLKSAYNRVIGKLVRMITEPDKWLIRKD